MNRKSGMFKLILKKISQIASSGIKVHVRINIDRENIGENFELNSILEEILEI